MPLRPKPNRNQPWPSLIPMRNGEPLPPIILTDPSILIGSGDAAQIRLRSKLVSKAHALLLVDGGRAYVRDLASRGHLWVNEEAVREAELTEGDVVRVGTFRFVLSEGATAEAAPAPVVRLRVGRNGEERRIAERVVLMGRRPGSDVLVADDSVSRGHVVLFWVNGGWHVRDLGSRTGTRVNGTAVRQQTELREGDVIGFGAAEVGFLGAVEERVTPAGVAVVVPAPVVVGAAGSDGSGACPADAGKPVGAPVAEGVWSRALIRAVAANTGQPAAAMEAAAAGVPAPPPEIREMTAPAAVGDAQAAAGASSLPEVYQVSVALKDGAGEPAFEAVGSCEAAAVERVESGVERPIEEEAKLEAPAAPEVAAVEGAEAAVEPGGVEGANVSAAVAGAPEAPGSKVEEVSGAEERARGDSGGIGVVADAPSPAWGTGVAAAAASLPWPGVEWDEPEAPGGDSGDDCVGFDPEGRPGDGRATPPAPVIGVRGLLAAAGATGDARRAVAERQQGGALAVGGNSGEAARCGVTVWGFEELARRVKPGAAEAAGTASEASRSPSSRWRRWRRVVLGAVGLVCVAGGVVLGVIVVHRGS